MSAHTPGPWSFARVLYGRGKRRCIEAPNGGTVAWATTQSVQATQAEANARLIAAAPDLLEALEETLALALNAFSTTDPYVAGVVAKARAAIQKATA